MDGGVSGAGCLAEDVSQTSWLDPQATPATGAGLYYLLRGENACGVGTYGFANAGERAPIAACP